MIDTQPNPGETLILAFGIVGLLSCPWWLIRFSQWAINREDDRRAGRSFERNFIPESFDVADTERELGITASRPSAFTEVLERAAAPGKALFEADLLALLDEVEGERQRLNAVVAEWVAS